MRGGVQESLDPSFGLHKLRASKIADSPARFWLPLRFFACGDSHTKNRMVSQSWFQNPKSVVRKPSILGKQQLRSLEAGGVVWASRFEVDFSSFEA